MLGGAWKDSDSVSFWLFAEVEAREACDWLRAAGFPQYAQSFTGKHPPPDLHASARPSGCGFPVDVETAKRDHSFLDKDALDSLCR